MPKKLEAPAVGTFVLEGATFSKYWQYWLADLFRFIDNFVVDGGTP